MEKIGEQKAEMEAKKATPPAVEQKPKKFKDRKKIKS
jgi:hypothetical protein